VLVYFDARGRWQSLHQWGWLSRAAELFSAKGVDLAVLSVDLPGWGDTAPTPSPFDVVGWGGVDRWTAYVSAATGDSVMAIRVREACRVLRWVCRAQGLPLHRVFVGGHGLGANVATYAAWLEGQVAGLVLNEPLLSFAELATATKPQWPHDAYFPGILNVADFPAALQAAGAPAIVVGPRDAAGTVAPRSRVWSQIRPNCRFIAETLNSTTEPQVIQWLHSRLARISLR
jgi:pimeloyl-ACP methyl ester carboxylesterase